MKSALAVLLAAGLVVGGYAWCRHRETVADHARAIAEARADSLAEQYADSLAAIRRTEDSAADASAARARLDSLATARAHQATLHADAVAAAALAALDSARTARDSLDEYRDRVVPALQSDLASTRAERDSLSAEAAHWHDGFDAEVRAAGALDGIVRADSIRLHTQQDSLYRLTHLPRSLWPTVGSYATTASLGVTTVYACEHGGLGCVVGSVATLVRLKPWKLLHHH